MRPVTVWQSLPGWFVQRRLLDLVGTHAIFAQQAHPTRMVVRLSERARSSPTRISSNTVTHENPLSDSDHTPSETRDLSNQVSLVLEPKATNINSANWLLNSTAFAHASTHLLQGIPEQAPACRDMPLRLPSRKLPPRALSCKLCKQKHHTGARSQQATSKRALGP